MAEGDCLEVPCGATDIEKQNNFWIDPAYLEVIEEMSRFLGETSSEYIDGVIKGQIKFILQNIDSGFYVYVEEICEKLDIDLWG